MIEDNKIKGEVVVTSNELGQCIAVTRQDDEGRILSIIWESKLNLNCKSTQHRLATLWGYEKKC